MVEPAVSCLAANDHQATVRPAHSIEPAAGTTLPARLESARRAGRKTVALLGAWVPEALFLACGAEPIRLDRLAVRSDGDGHLPRDVCAPARAAYDLLANRWIPQRLIDAVAIAAPCDWLTRMGDRLAARVPVWYLDVPRARTRQARSVRLCLASLRAMVGRLELLTDLPLTGRAFRSEVERESRLEQLVGRLDRLRAATPPSLTASRYYRALALLDLGEREHAARQLQQLAEEGAPAAPEGPTSRPRIVLCGCPAGFGRGEIVELIERVGLSVVGDDFSFHARRRLGPVQRIGGRQAALRWTARAIVEAAHAARRDVGERSAALARSRKADGIVWLHYRGCPWSGQGEAALAGDQDMRLLSLELERVWPVPEAVRTRLEAFRETLCRKVASRPARRDLGVERVVG